MCVGGYQLVKLIKKNKTQYFVWPLWESSCHWEKQVFLWEIFIRTKSFSVNNKNNFKKQMKRKKIASTTTNAVKRVLIINLNYPFQTHSLCQAFSHAINSSES